MLDRFQRFSATVSGITRNVHRIMNSVMEQYGLKGPYSIYITMLMQSPEGLTAAKISETAEKDKAAVSRAVSDLENAGIVTRIGNGYRAKIVLTPRGQELGRTVCSYASLAVERAGRDLTEEQRTQFYQALDSIAKNLQELEIATDQKENV